MLRAFGLALCIAALGFLSWQFVTADLRAVPAIEPARLVTALLAATAACALAALMLALAWRELLAGFGCAAKGQAGAHALTQALKYLPGNIGHVLGRHALGRRLGATHEGLAVATMTEFVLVATVASILALFAGPLALESLRPILDLGAETIIVGGLAVVLAMLVVFGLHKWVGALQWPSGRAGLWHIARASGLYALFFVLNAVGVFTLLQFGLQQPVLMPLALVGSLALSWLAGYVTPGAPAGLGIREFVLVVLVEPITGSSAALTLAVLYRISSMAGDLALAGLAALTASRTSTCSQEIPAR